MEKIKDNITKSQADMKTVDYLLEVIPDWNKILINRHHKFVNSYIDFKGKMTFVAKVYDFTEKDMLCIFWRIQKQLIREFVPRILNRQIDLTVKKPRLFTEFLAWQVTEMDGPNASKTLDSIKDIFEGKMTLNIDGVSKNKKKKIEEVLTELHKISNLNKLVSNQFFNILSDLFNGVPLTKVCEKHNRSLKYVSNVIIGSANGRGAYEKGLIYVINTSKEKVIYKRQDNKINNVFNLSDFKKKPKEKKVKEPVQLSGLLLELVGMIDEIPDWRNHVTKLQVIYVEALLEHGHLRKASEAIEVKENNVRTSLVNRNCKTSVYSRLLKVKETTK